MLWILLTLGVLTQPADETSDKVRKLIARLKDTKEPAAWAAALELGELGPAAKEAIPALRQRLQAKSAQERGHAAAALLLIDQAESPRAFPVLRDVFKDGKEVFAQLGLIRPLGQRLNPTTRESVEGLLSLGAEGEATGWIIADQALDRVKADNKAALAGLEAGLKHPHLKARILAARYLARLDPARVKDAVPILREGLALEEVSLRLIAAGHLLDLDSRQLSAVVAALTPGLNKGGAGSRTRIAVFLLGRDVALADKVVPVLRELLKGSEEEGHAVLHALGDVVRNKGDRFKAVFPLFEESLKGESVPLRVTAMRQLAGLGPLAQPADRLLRRAAGENNPEIAATALETLMRLRPENAVERVPDFVELVEKRDRGADGIREFLKQFDTLRKQQETRSMNLRVAGLVQLIEQSDREGEGGWSREELLRLHAITELGSLGTKAAKGVTILAKLVPDRDVKPLLRAQAALALGRIGKASRGVIPALNRAARDETETPDVRAAAREALRLIDRAKDS